MRGRFYLEDPAPENAEIFGNIKLHPWENESGKLLCKAWQGKQGKPYAYFSFPTEERRAAWMQRQRDNETARAASKAESKERAKADSEALRASTVVGSIFCWSGGYDQTRCEFYEVTARTKAMATVRQIGKVMVKDGGYNWSVKPNPGHFIGEPERVRIGANSIKVGSHQHAYPCASDSIHSESGHH